MGNSSKRATLGTSVCRLACSDNAQCKMIRNYLCDGMIRRSSILKPRLRTSHLVWKILVHYWGTKQTVKGWVNEGIRCFGLMIFRKLHVFAPDNNVIQSPKD